MWKITNQFNLFNPSDFLLAVFFVLYVVRCFRTFTFRSVLSFFLRTLLCDDRSVENPIFSLPVLNLLISALEVDNFYICLQLLWHPSNDDYSQWFQSLNHLLKSLAKFQSRCFRLHSPIGAAGYCAFLRYSVKNPIIAVFRWYVHVWNYTDSVHMQIMCYRMIAVLLPDVHSKWHTTFSDCHAEIRCDHTVEAF